MTQIIPRKPTLSELTGSVISWKELGIPRYPVVNITDYIIKAKDKYDFNNSTILLPGNVNNCTIGDLSGVGIRNLNIYALEGDNVYNLPYIYIHLEPNSQLTLTTNMSVIAYNFQGSIITDKNVTIYEGLNASKIKCNYLYLFNTTNTINCNNLQANFFDLYSITDATLSGTFNVFGMRIINTATLTISRYTIVNNFLINVEFNPFTVIYISSLGTVINEADLFAKYGSVLTVINDGKVINNGAMLSKIVSGNIENNNFLIITDVPTSFPASFSIKNNNKIECYADNIQKEAIQENLGSFYIPNKSKMILPNDNFQPYSYSKSFETYSPETLPVIFNFEYTGTIRYQADIFLNKGSYITVTIKLNNTEIYSQTFNDYENQIFLDIEISEKNSQLITLIDTDGEAFGDVVASFGFQPTL